MICQLCLTDKKLLKKSHIIPNFLYKGLFGKKHRLVDINLSDLSDRSFKQSGFYSKNILCAECDNVIIGSLERYASNTLYTQDTSKSSVTLEYYEGDNVHLPFTRYKGLDYTKTKLFFLSILWRAHLSNDAFFRNVVLNEKYSEILRQMILTNNPGLDSQFGVVLIYINAREERPTRTIIAPRTIEDEFSEMCVFHINEVLYHFNISLDNKNPLFQKGIIQRDGIIDIGILSGDFGKGYFDSFVGKTIPLVKK